MSPGPEDQWRPPEPPGRTPRPNGQKSSGRPRWMGLVFVVLAILALLAWQSTSGSSTARANIEYSEFMKLATDGHVQSIDYESSSTWHFFTKVTGTGTDLKGNVDPTGAFMMAGTHTLSGARVFFVGKAVLDRKSVV